MRHKSTPPNERITTINLKITDNGPYGLKRAVTPNGKTFFFNRNGVFDKTGKITFEKIASSFQPTK